MKNAIKKFSTVMILVSFAGLLIDPILIDLHLFNLIGYGFIRSIL